MTGWLLSLFADEKLMPCGSFLHYKSKGKWGGTYGRNIVTKICLTVNLTLSPKFN